MFGLLAGVIIHPRQAFTSLREAKRGYWWVVFVITILALALLTFTTGSIQMKAKPNFTPPAGVEIPEGVEISSPSMVQLVGYPLIGRTIGALLGYFISTFVVFALGFVFGGKATFKQMFRVVVWASLPVAIRYLVQAIASLVSGGIPVSGLGATLMPTESVNMPVLNTLLSQVDAYMVWSMVLLGIGVSATTKLSKGKTVLIVVFYLLIATAALIGWNLAGQAISNLLGGSVFGGQGGGPGPGGGRR